MRYAFFLLSSFLILSQVGCSKAVGCKSASDCSSNGTCVASPLSSNQFCVNIDASCPSGLRWDASSGDNLSNMCTDAVSQPTKDMSPAFSSSTPDDSGSSPYVPPPPQMDMGPPSQGLIFVESTMLAGKKHGYAIAEFANPLPTQSTAIGPCEYDAFAASPPPPATVPNAGNITMSGGNLPVTITVAGNGQYSAANTNDWMFTDGQTLVLSAPGATVPSFLALVQTPKQITVSNPAVSYTGLSIDRGQDFSVYFANGPTMGELHLAFTSSQPDGSFATLNCKYGGDATQAVVPKAALARMPAGQGSLRAYSSGESDTNVPGWTIHLSAAVNCVDSAGTTYGGSSIVFK